MRNVLNCELLYNDYISNDIFRLVFVWQGGTRAAPKAAPKAGQFFMVKPQRSAVFLGRPISLALWEPDTLTFMIAKKGRGTLELAPCEAVRWLR